MGMIMPRKAILKIKDKVAGTSEYWVNKSILLFGSCLIFVLTERNYISDILFLFMQHIFVYHLLCA